MYLKGNQNVEDFEVIKMGSLKVTTNKGLTKEEIAISKAPDLIVMPDGLTDLQQQEYIRLLP